MVVRLWKRWVELEFSEEEGCLVCIGVVLDIVWSGFILLKIGLKVGFKIFGVVEGEEFEEVLVMIEILEYEVVLILVLWIGF